MFAKTSPTALARRPTWLAAGVLCLALGTIGMVVPLLPTVDMYGLAAFCFARGDRRWEAWLLAHPRLGSPIRAWRESRVVPLSVKCAATLSMVLSCTVSAFWLPNGIAWVPLALCLPVSAYLWTRPSQAAAMQCKN